ncbi:hypothetical protein KFE25_012196 [Diacronema lutheri]|uniref:Sugar phosphate transporter domain-containing protein n=2 Tax=Diacronema lutheri TaxID=2081491 RepID=A0A8J5XBF5_DIALT|nr:hypothetical protein KFE25_012196 [Diacronema lutheri]
MAAPGHRQLVLLLLAHAFAARALVVEKPRMPASTLARRAAPLAQPTPGTRLACAAGVACAAGAGDDDDEVVFVPLGAASATGPPHFRRAGEAGAPVAESRRARALRLLRVCALLGAWYGCNFAYSITNKAALGLWPFPFTFGAIQLGVGIAYVLVLWSPLPVYDRAAPRRWRTTTLRAHPTFTREHVREMLPAAFLLAVGHTAATAAPAYGSVAFTNVVKTTETLFASICLALVSREIFPPLVYATLVPVVVGVALATVHELDFSWFTLGACGVSMNAFALYSIWAKRLMARSPYREHGAAALYSALTILSFALLVPAALLLEGRAIRAWWADAARDAAARADGGGALSARLVRLLVLTGLCNYLSNELAFCVLDLCSPLTYAVANTLKRVLVIVGSVLTFRTRVTPAGALGAGLALVGALLYSLALNSAHVHHRRAPAGELAARLAAASGRHAHAR